ncbi:MAG: protein kinase [Sideroxydans sp.]|nr:protein kinase [Sideroxydans sp.]
MLGHHGRYEMIGELGRGAMGVVYQARDPMIGRVVAIKTINLQSMSGAQREEYLLRFYQEARAAGRLSHPNIVTIHDVGEAGDMFYIAMELLEGRELQACLDEGIRLSIDEILDIGIQVSMGLAYAHQHEIVHRDIKPANLVVLNDGRVKIIDFGIAKMSSSLISTQSRMIMGSPLYMSPEQILNHPIDRRSDIFSLGIVLHQLLTGRLPFFGEDANSVMYQIVHEATPSPSSLNPGVPDMLDPVVAKCLAKNPGERYQTATELADDLRACRVKLRDAQAAVERLKHFKKAGDVTIHQLIYESRPTSEVTAEVLLDILSRTQYKNLRLGLSGLLVFHHGKFMQLLEGAEQDVKDLFEIIRRDPRHTDVKIILETNSPGRIMPSWVMGFHADSRDSEKISEQNFYISPDVIRQICESMEGAVGKTFMEFLRT